MVSLMWDYGRNPSSENNFRIFADGYVDNEAIPLASSMGRSAPSYRLLRIFGSVAKILSHPIRSLSGIWGYDPNGRSNHHI